MSPSPSEAFGPLLKRLRLARGYSQEDLAERAGISARAVSDLERGINRQPRRDTAILLLDALNPSGAERQRYLAASGRSPRSESAGPVQSELSRANAALPRLIGREAAMREIQSLILDPATRLVTLSGPGGVGKTRLALAAAAMVDSEFKDGATLVSLAAVADSTMVPGAIARAVGARETGGGGPLAVLADHLRERELLLILDNVEQVADVAPHLADLLVACASLRILTTSRIPLRLRIEREYPVSPLRPPPDAADYDVSQLMSQSAVALFVDRARAVRPGFQLTAANAAAVAEICRRLDGLPLALELAAARVNVLAAETIRDRLDQALDLLTAGPRDLPPRQRTLRAAIEWSYRLLLPPQQVLFRRLTPFVGGVCVEEVELALDEAPANLASAPRSSESMLDSLAALVDHHLIRVTDVGATTRFDMLETIRAFGYEALERSGELSATRHRHAEIFLELAERALAQFGGAGQASWLDRVEREHDNLRAALRWLVEMEDADRAVRMAAALWWFWWVRGYLSEGRSWLERALALPGVSPVTARTRALTGAGTIAELQGDLPGAKALHERALSLARDEGDERGLSRSLVSLGAIAFMEGDFLTAVGLWEEDLEICRAIGDELGLAHALFSLAKVAMTRGELADAAARYAECLMLLRGLADTRGVAAVLTDLGVLNHLSGDLDAARSRAEEAKAIWRDLGDRQGIARVHTNLAEIDLVEGRLADAEAGLRRASAISEEMGDRWGAAAVAVGRGRLELQRGDVDAAIELVMDGLRAFHDLGDWAEVAGALERLAEATIAQRRFERATALFGAAATVRTRLGVPMPAAAQREVDRQLESARAAVGASLFTVAWDAGAAWSGDERFAAIYELAASTRESGSLD